MGSILLIFFSNFRFAQEHLSHYQFSSSLMSYVPTRKGLLSAKRPIIILTISRSNRFFSRPLALVCSQWLGRDTDTGVEEIPYDV